MKRMKTMFLGITLFCCAMSVNAQEVAVDNNVDNTYIQIGANQEPITNVNLTLDELTAKVGELDTILEGDEFQLYASGDYTYRVENGIVVSQAIQIADEEDTKKTYNEILNALNKTHALRATHNTGGNFYQYADFRVQFDDFQGYSKLTFSVNPTDKDLSENNE